MAEETELMTVNNIQNRVYIIRDKQVMLDFDLAEIYGYEVKKMNQQVKRNIERFPDDFMFQLNREEIEFVKSQFVTSRNINMFEEQGNFLTHLLNREFICLRQFFVENWQNSKVYLLCAPSVKCVII